MNPDVSQPVESESRATAVPVLLTVPEACERLRISRWMLYELIRSRQLTTVKLGSRRLVPLAGITALVDRLAAEAD